MADIVTYFNWTYISTVASNGEYGEQGIDSFQREARGRNICIAVTAKLPHSSTPAHFKVVIQELLVSMANTSANGRIIAHFSRIWHRNSVNYGCKYMAIVMCF